MARRRTPARRTYRRPARRSAGDSLVAVGAVALLVVVVLSWIAAHVTAILVLGLLAAGITAAVLGVRSHRRRRAGETRALHARHISAYLTMTPKQFEHALADLCRRDGCSAVRVVGGAGDLAADVIATTPDGRRIVIQAKRFAPTTTVGSGEVQKLNGTYRDVHHAQLAAVVTTSRFTRPASELARRVGIRTFDQPRLAAWVAQTGPAPWQ